MTAPTILFLTSPEHGQANVQFATIAALQQLHPEVDIHLGSCESLRPRVPDGVTFHPIVGRGMSSYYDLKTTNPVEIKAILDYVTTRPTVSGFFEGGKKILSFMFPFSNEEYLESAKCVEQLVADLKPTLTLVDNFYGQAADGVQKSGVPWAKLSPNTVKEAAGGEQGNAIFSYPAPGIGFSYPLPWYLYPINVLALVWLKTWIVKYDPTQKRLNEARHAAGYRGLVPLFGKRTVPVLCMSHPRVELPLTVPDGVICCGPILSATKPLAEVDPELNDWVNRGPVILIVLGSHWRMTEEYARNVLEACYAILAARPDVRVLWKLQKFGDYDVKVDHERLRIVSWLKADPYAVLATGQVVCSINHGGSNSYHEALATGTPQIILSPWYDCHDFGMRVEWMGHGKWGNRNSAPNCSAPELIKALMAVVGPSPDAHEAMKFRMTAQKGADIINTRRSTIPGLVGDTSGLATGREVAAEWIWQQSTALLKDA